MKQKIGCLKVEEPISDVDVVFAAVYNLIYEKLETEPNKGIIISKGNPNQRKVRWKQVLEMAHTLEDYFACRKLQTGGDVCDTCTHWKSVSEASPWLGECTLRAKRPVHKFSTCKKFEGRTI